MAETQNQSSEEAFPVGDNPPPTGNRIAPEAFPVGDNPPPTGNIVAVEEDFAEPPPGTGN